MANFELFLKTGCFLLAIVFGTHYIRTWAFNRHEAITFECSSTAFLISILVIIRSGYTIQFGFIAAGLLVAFILNAALQWLFYMKLQNIVKQAFMKKSAALEKQEDVECISDMLQTMASVAIMPSFSRFIEESKVFNNPGNPIGLVKSVMKRQRFQKKKFLMRECFAENVNMIGPCKPTIDNIVLVPKHSVSGAIHANDLALQYSDEKKGLFSYDILGFGGLFVIWYTMTIFISSTSAVLKVGSLFTATMVFLTIVVFTYICHILRHFGFARYESITYELSCTSLIAAAFFVFMDALSPSGASPYECAVLVLLFLLFWYASFTNHKTDKALHREINKKFDDIIYHIPPVSEINRTKRKFLNNLKTVSEWAVVPFPGAGKRVKFFSKIMFTEKLKYFDAINQKKKDIPDLMEQLVDRVAPQHNESVNSDVFRVHDRRLIFTKRVLNMVGIAGLIITSVCTWMGIF